MALRCYRKRPLTVITLKAMIKYFEGTASLEYRLLRRGPPNVCYNREQGGTQCQMQLISTAHGEYSARVISQRTGFSYVSV